MENQDEKRIQEMEKEKRKLMEVVNEQQIMISRCVEKIERWEEREREIEDITKNELEKLEEENKDVENDTYVEPVDYGASQESMDSFASRLGVKPGEQKRGWTMTSLQRTI